MASYRDTFILFSFGIIYMTQLVGYCSPAWLRHCNTNGTTGIEGTNLTCPNTTNTTEDIGLFYKCPGGKCEVIQIQYKTLLTMVTIMLIGNTIAAAFYILCIKSTESYGKCFKYCGHLFFTATEVTNCILVLMYWTSNTNVFPLVETALWGFWLCAWSAAALLGAILIGLYLLYEWFADKHRQQRVETY